MQKSYYNNAITGNSSMLACISDKSELLRLFWPNIDHLQQFDKMLCGIFIKNRPGSTIWTNDNRCKHEQQYIYDTNIILNIITNEFDGYTIELLDFVDTKDDILVRRFKIINTSSERKELGLISFSVASSPDPDIASSMFDFKNEALIHYKANSYVAITTDFAAMQFQLGNNAYDAAINTYLYGADSIGMMKDAAVSWDLGMIEPGESKSINMYICISDTLKGCKSLVRGAKNRTAQSMFEDTQTYWRDYLKNAKKVSTGNVDLDDLYKRSILVFKLMYDKSSGGLLAAPEIDEYFTKCGRYAYCWGRDAAFITGALDLCGLDECVDNFYKWAVNTQDEDGSWHQRYHLDGNLAPCWGEQIDETATIIWGMLSHFKVVKRINFLEYVWHSVEAGVNFLINFMDNETGLPNISFDLWEERNGVHAYSSAAVFAGICSGIEIAKILGKTNELYKEWERVAQLIKISVDKHFWKEDYRRFIRSIRVKLNGYGQEPSQDTTIITVNPKGYSRDFTREDWIVDVSLIGLSIPFELYDPRDEKIRSTVELIEKTLTVQGVGGIKRYENDTYIGGNPWILTTLWVALYYAKIGNAQKAKEYLNWAANGRTELGLLPEQVNKDSGRPEWIIPLTWSHAMYVQVICELVDGDVAW